METIECTQSPAVKESAAAEEPTVQKRGRSPQKKGYLCCLLAGAAWGGGRRVRPVFIRSARLERGLYHPAAHPSGGGADAGCWPPAWRGGRTCCACLSPGRNRADVLVFGVLGIGLCQYSYYTTIRAANATTATILCYLGPVLIVLWVALRARRLRKPTKR